MSRSSQQLASLGLSRICLGTMRYSAGADLLCDLHDLGIHTHHSSREYDSDPKYRRALRAAMARGYTFKHVVKIAEPSWDEQELSAERFRHKVDQECRRLGVDHIEVMQWLVRTKDPHNESVCLPLLDRGRRAARRVFDELVAEGQIGAVVGFPYSTSMGHALRRETDSGPDQYGRGNGGPLVDGLSIYLNALEPERSDAAAMELTRGGPLLAIRPFAGGEIERRHRYASFLATAANPNVVSIIVSMSSTAQARELLNLLASLDEGPVLKAALS